MLFCAKRFVRKCYKVPFEGIRYDNNTAILRPEVALDLHCTLMVQCKSNGIICAGCLSLMTLFKASLTVR